MQQPDSWPFQQAHDTPSSMLQPQQATEPQHLLDAELPQQADDPTQALKQEREAESQRQLDTERQRRADADVQVLYQEREAESQRQHARELDDERQRAEQRHVDEQARAQDDGQKTRPTAQRDDPRSDNNDKDFTTWYFRGLEDKERQASYGLDPKYNMTPAGMILGTPDGQVGDVHDDHSTPVPTPAREKLEALREQSHQAPEHTSAREKLEAQRQRQTQQQVDLPSRVRQQMEAQRRPEPTRPPRDLGISR